MGDLERWLADAVAEQAARERAQERALVEAAEAESTLLGVLVDVAERGERIVVRTEGGRLVQGVVSAVGRVFAVVRAGDNAIAFVPVGGISVLRTESPEAPGGARGGVVDASLGAVLAGVAAADRPRVQVTVRGEEQPLVGELRSVGLDVVRLDLDGRTTTFLPLAQVVLLVLLG